MKQFDDTNYTGNPDFNYDQQEDYEGFMEIYEPFFSAVQKQYKSNPRTVWTVYDYEDDIHIRAGFHRKGETVNSIYIENVVHYFITLEEWNDPKETYIWFESSYSDT